MGVRYAGAGLALLAAVSGCGTWLPYDQRTVPISTSFGPEKLRADSLTASVTVAPDGVLTVTPRLDCARTRTDRVQEYKVEKFSYPIEGNRPHFLQAMLGVLFTGGGLAVAFWGKYNTKAVDNDEEGGDRLITLGLAIAAVAAIPLTVTIVNKLRHGGKRSRKLAGVTARDVEDVVPCRIEAIELATPWGDKQRVRVGKDGAARVVLDWQAAPLDVMDPDLSSQLAGAFSISVPGSGASPDSTSWSPDPIAVTSFAQALGQAKGVDVRGPEDGTDPPQLAVVAFEGTGLGSGRTGELVLSVRNLGGGPAFRLVGITKSDRPALHGKRFSFGRVAPGSTQTRKVSVTLPRDEPAARATVLVTFTEASNNQPSNYSRDFAIDRGQRPELVTSCDVAEGAERVGGELRVEAGQQLRVRCTVNNRGEAPATNATLSVSLDGVAKLSGRRSIAPASRGVFEVLVQIPVSFEIDSVHTLALELSETNFKTIERPPALSFTISRPAICTGKITRAEYDTRIAKLQTDLASGVIKPDAFARYKAQLLGCLE